MVFSPSHHAYVIEGVYDELIEATFNDIERSFGISVRGNPNVWHGFFDTFGIDEARTLKEMQATGALGEGSTRTFVLGCNRATREAQNALLKVLEEPTRNTLFILIVPRVSELIPTLRSRIEVVGTPAKRARNDDTTLADNFLSLGYAARMEYVKKLTKKISDAKDHGPAYRLIDSIEFKLAHLAPKQKTAPETGAAIASVLMAQQLIRSKGASVKHLLEHIALTVPEM